MNHFHFDFQYHYKYDYGNHCQTQFVCSIKFKGKLGCLTNFKFDHLVIVYFQATFYQL